MRLWCYDEETLNAALEAWAAEQRQKNPALVDKHIDYMLASIQAFLYSGSTSELRTADIAGALDILGAIENAHKVTADRKLSQTEKPDHRSVGASQPGGGVQRNGQNIPG